MWRAGCRLSPQVHDLGPATCHLSALVFASHCSAALAHQYCMTAPYRGAQFVLSITTASHVHLPVRLPQHGTGDTGLASRLRTRQQSGRHGQLLAVMLPPQWDSPVQTLLECPYSGTTEPTAEHVSAPCVWPAPDHADLRGPRASTRGEQRTELGLPVGSQHHRTSAHTSAHCHSDCNRLRAAPAENALTNAGGGRWLHLVA